MKPTQNTEKIQDDFWKILQNVNEWIKFSDQKAVFVVSTYSIILTLIYSNADEIYVAISGSLILIIGSVIASLISVISIFLSFKCLTPILNNTFTSSIFFFGHIANHNDHNQYYNHAKSIIKNRRAIEENLAEQIYTNSKIAKRKFTLVSWSIKCQVASIFVIIISLSIYFLQ